jgi:uncharacterized protein (DUF58 family)
VDPARDPGSDGRPALGGRLGAGAERRQRRRRREGRAAAFGRERRWLRAPRTLRPTRAGWSFFAFTLGVGFAALNTGNNLLYLVLALMLSFLVLSGVLSEAALRGIRVRRRLPAELFAGRGARVTLEIQNAQRRVAAFAIVVEDRVAEPGHADRAAGRCVALRIAPGKSEVRSYAFEPRRRGSLQFHGFVVSTRFPFGLFSKSLRLDAPEQTLVYPALEPVPPAAPAAAAAAGGEQPLPRDGGGDAADGLRDFAPGDPARRIHWRASTRARRLLVRRRSGDEAAELEVLLPTAGSEPGDAFERRVSRAASEVVAGLDAGRRVGLRAGAERIRAAAGPRQRARLLTCLARIEPERPGLPGESAA